LVWKIIPGPIKKKVPVTRPPLLKSTNYAYRKTRIKIFIKTLDTTAWKAVQKESKPPTKTSTTNFGELELKSIDDWTDEDCRLDNVNTKVLNAIFLLLDLKNLS
jgi:hypothetical protein